MMQSMRSCISLDVRVPVLSLKTYSTIPRSSTMSLFRALAPSPSGPSLISGSNAMYTEHCDTSSQSPWYAFDSASGQAQGVPHVQDRLKPLRTCQYRCCIIDVTKTSQGYTQQMTVLSNTMLCSTYSYIHLSNREAL